MANPADLLALAKTRIGQKYVNICVPKNNPNWKGPWDCAEFMSWLVYQVGGYLYGCIDNNANPATVEAYTGAWKVDAKKRGKMIPWQEAAAITGAILLRYPPSPGAMGHIAVSDGQGGTVEARGTKWGVVAHTANGRGWDTGILLPDFEYGEANGGVVVSEPSVLYKIGAPNMRKDVVREIQTAVAAAGFDPGPVDGMYGHNTAVAVAAFQADRGLTADGQVGKQTAAKLKVDLGDDD